MELPKETIERIEEEAEKMVLIEVDPIFKLVYKSALVKGMRYEALRSLSEIEKLKEEIERIKSTEEEEAQNALKNYESIRDGLVKRINELKSQNLELESQNKELMEALRGIANSCDNQNPTHETIWRIADSIFTKPSQ